MLSNHNTISKTGTYSGRCAVQSENTHLKKRFRTVAILFLFVLLNMVPAKAQTNHIVTLGDFFFSPANLTIEVGDTVTWIQTVGMHNVDGQTSVFPSNPESFYSGPPTTTPWTYSFVFTLEGFYNYRCDPHFIFGMTGTVTVEAAVDPCPAPVGLTSSNTGTHIIVSWTDDPVYNAFQLRGKPFGAPGWASKTSTSNSITLPLSIMLPDTIYEWKVRARCNPDNAISGYSTTETFSTATLRTADPSGQANQGGTLELFPNPAKDYIRIPLDVTQSGDMNYRVFNAVGDLLRWGTVEASSGNTDAIVYISGFTPGFYVVETTQNGRTKTAQLVVN